MADKTLLARSNAGMRLIAQTTFLNQADFERLHDFIRQSYNDDALRDQPTEERLAELRALAAQAGRLRVHQVIAYDKHQVVVLMQPEHEDCFYTIELAVEEDYPHKILAYRHELVLKV